MVGESVESALQTLRTERDRISDAISALEGLVVTGGNAGMGRSGRAGRGRRRPGRPASGMGRGGSRRKNAPRGLLKQKIHEVLKGARKPLAPVELRNLVIKAGYPTKKPKTLYTAIFTSAKADPLIKKTSEGFSLK